MNDAALKIPFTANFLNKHSETIFNQRDWIIASGYVEVDLPPHQTLFVTFWKKGVQIARHKLENSHETQWAYAKKTKSVVNFDQIDLASPPDCSLKVQGNIYLTN
ncbi:hypothetical protein [Bacillus cereus]|uniref:hypothetical protein n=1 Tax=Bacillus cereus TaxID=1396 RepID=UPI000BEB5050|nr:hypothetical protein [Bacillus cereus]PEA01011.1 hypothetical protein CON37_30325 [Bacillus cereus]